VTTSGFLDLIQSIVNLCGGKALRITCGRRQHDVFETPNSIMLGTLIAIDATQSYAKNCWLMRKIAALGRELCGR
jgi:hypothetical protein